MTLGEKIYFYRKQCALSQEELAERVGVSRQAVSKWELGDALPDVDKLLTLAKTFGVTTDELLSPDPPADGSENDEVPRQAVPPDRHLDLSVIGRFAKRYGFLAGCVIAVLGLVLLYQGFILATVGGQLHHMVFPSEGTSDTLLTDEGEMMSGNTTITVNGQEFSFDGSVSPVGGAAENTVSTVAGILQTVGILQLVAGIVMVICGAVLAKHLWEKRNKNTSPEKQAEENSPED